MHVSSAELSQSLVSETHVPSLSRGTWGGIGRRHEQGQGGTRQCPEAQFERSAPLDPCMHIRTPTHVYSHAHSYGAHTCICACIISLPAAHSLSPPERAFSSFTKTEQNRTKLCQVPRAIYTGSSTGARLPPVLTRQTRPCAPCPGETRWAGRSHSLLAGEQGQPLRMAGYLSPKHKAKGLPAVGSGAGARPG